MVGFRLVSDTTKDDFDLIVLPSIAELIKRIDKLNYLLVVEHPIKNFAIGAWTKDALIRLNQFSKLNRMALVSNTKEIGKFFETFSKEIPGEFRLFDIDELDKAISWVSEHHALSKEEALQENEKAYD